MWQHPQTYSLKWGVKGGKVHFTTGWAQRVNGSYSLFNIKNVWILSGSVSCSDFRCRRWVCPSLLSAEESCCICWCWLVLLLSWRPCLAYLTPFTDAIRCEVRPFTADNSFSIPDLKAWDELLCVEVVYQEGASVAEMQPIRQAILLHNRLLHHSYQNPYALSGISNWRVCMSIQASLWNQMKPEF